MLLILGILVLAPGQSRHVLGIELLVYGVTVVVVTAALESGTLPRLRPAERGRWALQRLGRAPVCELGITTATVSAVEQAHAEARRGVRIEFHPLQRRDASRGQPLNEHDPEASIPQLVCELTPSTVVLSNGDSCDRLVRREFWRVVNEEVGQSVGGHRSCEQISLAQVAPETLQ